MVRVKLYVEGGGNPDFLKSRCRQGFRGLLEKAGFSGRMPRIVACGARGDAYDNLKTACEQGQVALLLVDSEEFVSESSPWQHLAKVSAGGFNAPRGASDDHCHLMVVCMESWFLADKEALAWFFGQGFNQNALPKNRNIEAIAKDDVFQGIENATRHSTTKGQYDKKKHSFEILPLVNPNKLCNASPWARRFFNKLEAFLRA